MSSVAIFMRTVGVAFNVYVSSRVGAEGMGLLSLTGTVYGFGVTLATSGVNLAVTRLVSGALPYENESYFDGKADRRVRKIMKNAFSYCLFFSLLASVLLYFFSHPIAILALRDARTESSLKIMSFTLVPIALSSALNGYFNAVRRVYKSVIVQVCEQGAKIGVVSSLLILIAPRGLEYACIAVVAGGAVSEALCVAISATLYLFDRKLHKRLENGKSDCIKGFFCQTGVKGEKEPCSVASIALPVAVSAYVRSALVTVEHLAIPWGLKKSGASAQASLASYGVLHGMVFPILLFPSAVSSAFASLLIPELSAAFEQKDTGRIQRIASRVFYLCLVFSIGIGGIFTCFAHEIGTFIYGNEGAAEYIRLLAPLIPLMYLDTAVDSMLKGLGEQLYTMRVNIVDSFLSVVLVLTLLPLMGIRGYVITIFLMELLNTSLSILRLLRVTGIRPKVFAWVVVPLGCILGATVITRFAFSSSLYYSFLIRIGTAKALSFLEIGSCATVYVMLWRLVARIKSKVKFSATA